MSDEKLMQAGVKMADMMREVIEKLSEIAVEIIDDENLDEHDKLVITATFFIEHLTRGISANPYEAIGILERAKYNILTIGEEEDEHGGVRRNELSYL